MKKTNLSLIIIAIILLSGCYFPGLSQNTNTVENKSDNKIRLEDKEDPVISTESNEQTAGYVTFWFDDGLLSVYEKAYPVLEENGWEAVVAVVSNREIATEKFLPEGEPPMSWEQLQELYHSGWEISNHSSTHSRLNEIDQLYILEEEILHSKNDLEEKGFTVPSFTFPYGQNGLDKGQKIITDNYFYWRSSTEKINPVPAWRHLTSFVVSEDTTVEEVENWVNQTEEEGGWLIVMLHGIVDEPFNPWQQTEEQFLSIVQIIRDSSLEIVLPNYMYNRFGYAEGGTPQLSTEDIVVPIGVDTDSFSQKVLLEIPKLEISHNLLFVCDEDEYDFSILHEGPIWMCPDASPYLTNIGSYGASIVLGHRQWGPKPKVFAKLDLLEEGDRLSVADSEKEIEFEVVNTLVINPEALWQEIAKYHIDGKENRQSFLILITCTPYGTDLMRLIVILERIG